MCRRHERNINKEHNFSLFYTTAAKRYTKIKQEVVIKGMKNTQKVERNLHKEARQRYKYVNKETAEQNRK